MKDEIRERPILFSSEMVRAILDDKKTETRRVMKPQPSKLAQWLSWGRSAFTPRGFVEGRGLFPSLGKSTWLFKSPYGDVGDILYVRETFLYDEVGGAYSPGCPRGVIYKANAELWENFDLGQSRWTPSIHMPKKFSRIKLKIKEIRVERIQDISNDDCLAEGVPDEYYKCPHGPLYCSVFKGCFRKTWDSLNKKRGFGWDTNCYVWVIKFERIS